MQTTLLRQADERFMLTGPITPMESEMLNELTRGFGLPESSLQFRQRISGYHLRYLFWARLSEREVDRLKIIAGKHGYKCTESENGPDDKMTRWSYDFTQVTP